MRHKLQIGENFQLPDDTVTSTLIVYGGKGMGKTVFGAVLFEEMACIQQRVCLIDPVGRSWGLRYGADGKSPGLDILILGGRYGDIPIEPTGGAVVADLVADESVNTLIDISSRPDGQGWTHGERYRFMADYASRLYERQQIKRRPIFQIIDEAGRFAPEQIPKDAANIAACKGAIEQLVEWGRNAAIGVCLITQRSARMAKAVSELADCMVSFRTIGPNSVKAIMDWLGDNVPSKEQGTLLDQLRKLDRGEALIVSPGWLKFEGTGKIRMRQTFDSSATPKGGHVNVRGGRKPDLVKYSQRMIETIEKAKANDPQALQQRIRELEKENKRLASAPPSAIIRDKVHVQEKIVEKPVLRNKELDRMHHIQLQIQKAVDKLEGDVPILTEALRHGQEMIGEIERLLKPAWQERLQKDGSLPPTKPDLRLVAAPASRMPKLPKNVVVKSPVATAPVPSPTISDNGDRKAGERILDAIAWWESVGVSAPSRAQVGMIAAVGYRGGYFDQVVSPLSAAGYITRSGGVIRLTDAGRSLAKPPADIRTLDQYLAKIRQQVQPKATLKMFDALVQRFRQTLKTPVEMTREELGEASQVGYAGGYFDQAISPLSKLELIARSGGRITSTDLLFPKILLPAAATRSSVNG
jgi:uncharacterized phosphosugar-binding protein